MTQSAVPSPAPAGATRTVGEGDDLITYDVRGDLADATPDRPVLVLCGSPMDASGFGSLARRAVVHEPPTAIGLPDEDVLLGACRDLADTYAASGQGPAMARFIALVMHDGPLPADWNSRPAPDPAAFGQPTEDDGDRTEALFRNGPACNAFAVDRDRLAPLGDRVAVAVGLESGQTMAARGGRQVAAALGLPVTDFPSHHAGFACGEFGQQGDPDGFAARLHEVLDR